MIGLKNATPEEFEELYVKYGISGSMDLSIPTFYFSLVMEENIIGYVKLTFRDEDYYLEEIKYDDGMERFNRFFLKCIAYKIYLKEKKTFYSRIFFDGILGITKKEENLYICDIEEILEQGKSCSGCKNK